MTFPPHCNDLSAFSVLLKHDLVFSKVCAFIGTSDVLCFALTCTEVYRAVKDMYQRDRLPLQSLVSFVMGGDEMKTYFLENLGGFEPLDIRTKTTLMSSVVALNSVGTLAFLRNQDPPCPWDESTCCAAAEGGHQEVLMWLRSQDPPCPWDEYECRRWSQDPPCPWDEYVCQAAAGGGHLEVLKWLRSQAPPWHYRKDV